MLALAAVLCAATLLAGGSGRATADGPISGPPGIIETYVGGGTGGEGSPRLEAAIVPFRLAFSPSGELYFGDWFQTQSIRKISGDTVVRVAGGGSPTTGIGDGGSPLNATFQRPFGLAFESDGSLIIADEFNCAIRRVESDGSIIQTIVGVPDNDCSGAYVDGAPPAVSNLQFPQGVALDGTGALVVGDTQYCIIRRVEGGTLMTVAGVVADCSDGGAGPATTTPISGVYDVEVAPNGDLVFVGGCSIKRLRNGVVTTLKNYPSCTYGGPTDLAVSPTGAIFIGHFDCRVTMLSEGVETTLTGSSTDCSYSGDGGLAKNARVRIISGVALDSAGNLFLSDITDQEPNSEHFIRVIYGAAADTDGDGYMDAAEANIGEDHTTFCQIMRADVSRDGIVNVADLGRLASQFGPNPEYPRYDQNADAVINPADLGLVASVFGKWPTACP